uniref:Uncharacterized protein n=1 Tax=Leersia perrieri TaxID=77586 RepID=A0A0D9XSB8_9ORYZ
MKVVDTDRRYAAVLYLLLRKGGRLGFAGGTAQYGPRQQHELRCLFTLAAGLTVPVYVGLVGHVVIQFRTSSRVQEMDGTATSLAAVAGLMLMLLTSSPPAFIFPVTRDALVERLLGTLANVQLALVGAAGLSAARGAAPGEFVRVRGANAVQRRVRRRRPRRVGQLAKEGRGRRGGLSARRQPHKHGAAVQGRPYRDRRVRLISSCSKVWC